MEMRERAEGRGALGVGHGVRMRCKPSSTLSG